MHRRGPSRETFFQAGRLLPTAGASPPSVLPHLETQSVFAAGPVLPTGTDLPERVELAQHPSRTGYEVLEYQRCPPRPWRERRGRRRMNQAARQDEERRDEARRGETRRDEAKRGEEGREGKREEKWGARSQRRLVGVRGRGVGDGDRGGERKWNAAKRRRWKHERFPFPLPVLPTRDGSEEEEVEGRGAGGGQRRRASVERGQSLRLVRVFGAVASGRASFS